MDTYRFRIGLLLLIQPRHNWGGWPDLAKRKCAHTSLFAMCLKTFEKNNTPNTGWFKPLSPRGKMMLFSALEIPALEFALLGAETHTDLVQRILNRNDGVLLCPIVEQGDHLIGTEQLVGV